MSQARTDRAAWKQEDWRNRVINWHLLRGFGQSAPASITMSTPFVGYMILYHSQVEEFLGGLGGSLDQQMRPGTCERWIEFSMRLNIVYVGLLLLGIGTILYRVFAPEIVKRAKDINEYVIETIDIVSARNLRSMYATVISRRPYLAPSFNQRAPWLNREKSLKTASDALRKDDDNQIKIDVLRSFYNVQDRHTLRRIVYTVLGFYVAGFILLAFPGLVFTGRVLCAVGFDLGLLET